MKPKTSRVSQTQIARDLGLSQALVSMVLNGRRSGVSEESYLKIWNHARQMGYKPKGMDPTMIQPGHEEKSIGFLLRSGLTLYTQSNFFSHVQHGLHEFLQSKGYSLVFLGSEEHLDARQFKDIYADPNQRLRGLIILGEVRHSFLHALKALEPRIVSVSAQYSGMCHSVLSNEEQAAQQLIQHLADLGHRRFAWLGGSAGMQRSLQRFQAIQGALRLRGFAWDPSSEILIHEADRQEGRNAAEILLERHGKKKLPTAWICYNGLMARGAANYLLQQGIRIPDQVSIAAFDRTRVCHEEHPFLTGAGATPEKMGAVAGELLLKSTGKAEEIFSDIVLASELLQGESTAAASSSPLHAKAIATSA
jgi:LacI family transcriptional regulator